MANRFKKKHIIIMILTLIMMFNINAVNAAAEELPINSSGVPNRALNVDPIGINEGFSAVLYDNTKGLPTSEANAIAETSEGFIWIGSYAGLIRYDGIPMDAKLRYSPKRKLPLC